PPPTPSSTLFPYTTLFRSYQEAVMQIFNQLGGIELSNAYKLIKAISKKTTDVIAKFHPDFIKGTMAKGVSKEKAEEIGVEFGDEDRKSTRLNSSHSQISYA